MNFDYQPVLTTALAASALEEAPATGHAHANTTCLNCNTALHGRFCGHCGQAGDTHRITLKHFLFHDLPHSVWHVDKGLTYTFWQMITRPGFAIREYLAGRRAQHFRPISYVLLLVAISALVMSSFQPILTQAAIVGQAKTAAFQIIMERYFTLYTKHPALMQLILLPLNSLVAWLLLRRAGYNFAEVLLANAFISGTLTVINLLCMLPAMLLAGPAGMQLVSQLVFIPTLLYPLWVNAQLLLAAPRLSTGRRYGRALSIAVLQIIVLLLASVVAIAAITVQVLREQPELLKQLQPQKPAAAQPVPAARRP